jgi:hypothetical protein
MAVGQFDRIDARSGWSFAMPDQDAKPLTL